MKNEQLIEVETIGKFHGSQQEGGRPGWLSVWKSLLFCRLRQSHGLNYVLHVKQDYWLFCAVVVVAD